MKIIIAPDAYKGSLSAIDVALCIEEGFSAIFPSADLVCIPMADGGEGTLECFLENEDHELYYATVTGPLKEAVTAPFGILKDNTAVIEMAKASGLTLISPEDRNPLKTTTLGTGELIRCALDKNCRRFIIALGGSATCDGGMGALSALGVQFKDKHNQIIEPIGKNLIHVSGIDFSRLDPRLKDSTFIIAHDVDNALLGQEGAIQYAPQKGATSDQVELLYKGFENYARILKQFTHKNIDDVPGTGAAGGLAAGLLAVLNATLEKGASVVMQAVHLKEKMKNADFVITGEGQIDLQTIRGKTPIAVAQCAKTLDIPVIAIAACLGKGYDAVYDHGIDAVFSIVNNPMSQVICMEFTKPLLTAAANNIARLLKLKRI